MTERARFELAPRSAAEARRFVAACLEAHGRPELIDPLSLIVSELATNALLHARSPFEVDVRVDGDRIVVGVTDTGPGEVRSLAPDEHSPSGRGLTILASLCDDWGVDDRDEGKRVWCVVATGRQPAGSRG